MKKIFSSINNEISLFSFDKPVTSEAFDKILREIHEKYAPDDSYPK
jgi:hypothetical protein